VSLLPSEALDLRDRHALYAYLVQGVPDLVEFEMFDDSFYLLFGPPIQTD